MRAVLEALRMELRPMDLAVAAIAIAWLGELVVTIHDRVVWRDGYAAGIAGAQVRARELEERHA